MTEADRERRVFILEASSDVDRPQIDFQLAENTANDWLELDEVLLGERCIEEYRGIDVDVAHPDACHWDFYSVPGTLGLLSKKAVALLLPYASRCFNFLEATLNSRPYYFLKPTRPLDCLDRHRSVIVRFRSNPTRIKDVKEFCFKKEMIVGPLVFSIPETPRLFATESVVRAIRERGLRGFRAVEIAN